KLCIIITFHSKHMTSNNDNKEEEDKNKTLMIRNELKEYLQSLKNLTEKLTLKIYELKKFNIATSNEIIISSLKEEKYNIKKFVKGSIFNKEDLDLGHDNLITLKCPVEIIDD